MTDESFKPNPRDLQRALNVLLRPAPNAALPSFATTLPEHGIGESETLELLAPIVIGGARHLGVETAFAHMDPPTPWITWSMTMWSAALNQNLLHPDVAPVAREIETQAIAWLAPFFGMSGGHMTPGATVANLTALWAARELCGIRRVCASSAAHLSVAKAAHILNLEFLEVETDRYGRMDPTQIPANLADTALVLTAGTTNAGAVDLFEQQIDAAWTHVDAAWAGPLRLSSLHRGRLAGIETADSVAVSAHKWLFQPKESGLVLFRDVATAHQALSFGAEYLAIPNVGILGSHGANALPLLATLLSWGRAGVERRINAAMSLADQLLAFLGELDNVTVYAANTTGVILWRSTVGSDVRRIVARLPVGAASVTTVDGYRWIRHVAANPNLNLSKLTNAIAGALAGS